MSEDHIITQAEANRVMVMKLYLSGKRPSEIVEDTGLSEKTIKTYLREANERVSFEMVELADTMQLRNLARTEQIFSKVWPFALGEYIDPETGELKASYPDKDMAKLALQIIKMQDDQSKEILEAYRKQQEEERNLDDIVVSERTFTGNTELYNLALQNMRQEYLEAGETFEEFDIDRLYNQDPEAPLGDPRLDELRSKLPEIEEEYDSDLREETERNSEE